MFRKKRTYRAAGIGIVCLIIAPLLLTGCDVFGTSIPDAAVLHVTAYYFQQFYAPNLSAPSQPAFCTGVPAPTDQNWYVLVAIDGIDNPSTGVASFTLDANSLHPSQANNGVSLTSQVGAYLDPYWQPHAVSASAGQSLDVTKVHQGVVFLDAFGASTPASQLADDPPILGQQGTLLQWASHVVIQLPDSAQPTNTTLVNLYSIPLVTAGPCS